MRRKRKRNIVVGLDVGTTKICSVIAEPAPDGQMHILGVGTSPSKGLLKGTVVNIESTVDSIGRAVDEAEEAAGCEVQSVFVGIAGGHIKSQNSRGVVSINSDSKEITEGDVRRVIESAQAITLSIDREILHAIPQTFIVDGQDGVKNPIGLCGMRLEADVHIVTGAVTSAQNIIKCVNLAGFQAEDIVLQPLASSIATLTEVDKEVGVLLIDIGGGTTDFIIFSDDTVRHSDVLTMGGDLITRDISQILKIPEANAESIKQKYGHAMSNEVRENEEFPLPPTVGREARNEPRKMLAEIIEYRMREILNIVKEEVERNKCGDKIGAGVVLTGGACLLKGSKELTRLVFNNIPTRVGRPLNIANNPPELDNPIYSTGVGLARYGLDFRDKGERRMDLNQRKIFRDVFKKMQNWVKNRFRFLG
jgi:cell division protein FtsA